MSTADMISEFHRAFGQSFGDGGSSNALRARLHAEESRELCDELELLDDLEARGFTPNRRELADVAKELADVVYVAYGTAFSLGIDLDAVLAEVHRSNMAKRGPDGRFMFREDGKVLKGPGYTPPDIAAVLTGEDS